MIQRAARAKPGVALASPAGQPPSAAQVAWSSSAPAARWMGAVHAAPAGQAGVGGVHHGIDLLGGDVAVDGLEAGRHGPQCGSVYEVGAGGALDP